MPNVSKILADDTHLLINGRNTTNLLSSLTVKVQTRIVFKKGCKRCRAVLQFKINIRSIYM